MTLLSVYEPEMRERIEAFCADSHVAAQGTSYNPLITVSPTHIIRATVGLGFKRGCLRYAYQIMRGRDLKTKETSAKTRSENFETFGNALDKVLDLNNWHAYINILAQAGYINSTQVTSANALVQGWACRRHPSHHLCSRQGRARQDGISLHWRFQARRAKRGQSVDRR